MKSTKQVTDENRTCRLDVTMNGLEETEQMATASLDVELVEKGDRKNAMAAAEKLLVSGALTEVQRRRFILHFFQGLSTRQIARLEGVHQKAIWKSINLAKEKLRFFFEK